MNQTICDVCERLMASTEGMSYQDVISHLTASTRADVCLQCIVNVAGKEWINSKEEQIYQIIERFFAKSKIEHVVPALTLSKVIMRELREDGELEEGNTTSLVQEGMLRGEESG